MALRADLLTALEKMSPQMRGTLKKPLARFVDRLQRSEYIVEVGFIGDDLVVVTSTSRYVLEPGGIPKSRSQIVLNEVLKPEPDGALVGHLTAPRLDRPINLTVNACRVLGGSGFPLCLGDVFDLRFDERGLLMVRSGSGDAMVMLAYPEIVSISIVEPGAQTRGGGFGGGGFGLEGAAIGMGVAALINAATTTSEVTTVLEILTDAGELFLLYRGEEPGPLRMRLSAVFTRLRMSPHQHTEEAPASD